MKIVVSIDWFVGRFSVKDSRDFTVILVSCPWSHSL